MGPVRHRLLLTMIRKPPPAQGGTRRRRRVILNARKCLSRTPTVGRLFFSYSRAPTPKRRGWRGDEHFACRLITHGLRVGKVFNKSGWRFYQNAELIFENARGASRQPAGRGGRRTEGARRQIREFAELEYAANAVGGVCDAAIEMATLSARTRWPGATDISGNQVIQLKLSEMHMLTEACARS